jgi:hypothetical protein
MKDFFSNGLSVGSKKLNSRHYGFDSILTRSKIDSPHFTDNFIHNNSESIFSSPFEKSEISAIDKRKTTINLEVIARDKIGRNLRPYTKSDTGELRAIASSDIKEEIIATFVLTKLRNPSPVVLWYNPKMVKLAETPIRSRITGIAAYEKTKADLYQAIEDLEQTHQQFLKDNAAKIESVLEKGHNFIL